MRRGERGEVREEGCSERRGVEVRGERSVVRERSEVRERGV